MSAARPSATRSQPQPGDVVDRPPGEDVRERRPRQEEQPEERPEPAREGRVDLVAEDPPDQEREARADEAGGEGETAHGVRQPTTAREQRATARSWAGLAAPRAELRSVARRDEARAPARPADRPRREPAQGRRRDRDGDDVDHGRGRRSDDDSSTTTTFRRSARGLWWAVQTVTTVGYGDRCADQRAGPAARHRS